MKKKFIGIYNKSEIITLLGLMFAALGIFSSMSGNALYGVFCLMIAGMCDAFDGVVAKKISRDKSAEFYGVQLDSLVDIVSFGALPVIIGWSLGNNSAPDVFIYIFYLCCGVIRLAYFNTLSAERQSKPRYFAGLPITSISAILPLFYFLFERFNFIYGYRLVFLIAGLLYILNIKIKKPDLVFRIMLCAIGVLVIISTYLFWG